MGRSTLNRVLRAVFRPIREADIPAGGGKAACRDFFNSTDRLLPFTGAQDFHAHCCAIGWCDLDGKSSAGAVSHAGYCPTFNECCSKARPMPRVNAEPSPDRVP